MSQIYSIKNLLNIKDKNITFTENGISMENFKGVYSKIIHAKLSYSPNQCPHCHGKDIIKWGSKTSNIRLLKILEYNSILKLQKQRFRCKNCGYQSNEDRIGAMNLWRKGIEYIEKQNSKEVVE